MSLATEADLPVITDFRQARAGTATFPVNNLRHSGTAGTHLVSLRIFMQRQAGHVSDARAVTRAGMVLPWFIPDAAGAAAGVLRGQEASVLRVKRATLCASSDPAARAYTAIGFKKIGSWSQVVFVGTRSVAV